MTRIGVVGGGRAATLHADPEGLPAGEVERPHRPALAPDLEAGDAVRGADREQVDLVPLDRLAAARIDDVQRDRRALVTQSHLDLVRSVQRGLASRGYRPGPLVLDEAMGLNSEHTVAAIKAWYQEAMPPRAELG